MAVKVTDIKKLFALSSNRCAFEDCSIKMIDRNVVLGEICHIKAQSPGGPRFDSNLTQEEIDAFGNLILLCPSHHKIIDTDVSSYTVELLTDLKNRHESSSTEELQLDDELAQKLVDSIRVEQYNISSLAPVAIGSNLNSPINITVNQGATKEQIYELAKLLAEENFPKLALQTMQKVDERLEKFRNQFSEEVINNKSELDIGKLATPAIQKVLLNAQESVASSEEDWTSKCLNDLILDSIRKGSDNFEVIITKEATSIIGNLWEDVVKILAFKFSCEFISFP